jgi:hypothetical protein
MGVRKQFPKTSPQTHHEAKAGISEQELIAALEKAIREDNTNPKRSGCPGKSMLRELAKEGSVKSGDVIAHVLQCAPCLKEYDGFRAELQRHKARR